MSGRGGWFWGVAGRDGCQAKDHCFGWYLNVCNSETTGYFLQDLGSFSSPVCGDRSRYFKSNPNQVEFLPKPYQSASSAQLDTNRELQHLKFKMLIFGLGFGLQERTTFILATGLL